MELKCVDLPHYLFVEACGRYQRTVGHRNEKQKTINKTKVLMLQMKMEGFKNREIKEKLSLSHRLDGINGICAQTDWRVFSIAVEMAKHYSKE